MDPFIFSLYFPSVFILAKADVFVAFIRYVFAEVPKDKTNHITEKDIP